MGYLEQHDRMLRWAARVRAMLPDPPLDGEPLDYALDTMYACFEACFHLRDWIANDEDLPRTVRDDVYGFVRKSQHLSMCADVANGVKHLRVDRPLSDRNPPPERREIGLVEFRSEGWPLPETPEYVFGVLLDGDLIDVFSLVADCVRAWDQFFAKHGITPASPPAS